MQSLFLDTDLDNACISQKLLNCTVIIIMDKNREYGTFLSSLVFAISILEPLRAG